LSSGFLLLTEIGTLLDTLVERARIYHYEIIPIFNILFLLTDYIYESFS
jgi:hypothetical protein